VSTIIAPGALAPISPGPTTSANPTDTYFSYRAGVQFDVTKDLMAYATYTRGYKGPAVNDQTTLASLAPLTVKPEVPKAIEAGVKSSFLNGRFSLNAAAFHTDVENFQFQTYEQQTASFAFVNAPTFTSNGVSATLFGRPLPGLLINIGAIYTRTRYGRGSLTINAQNQIVDAHDQGVGKVLQGSASAEYTTALGAGVNGFVQADVSYTSKRYSDAARSEVLSSPKAAIVGGRVGARFMEDRFGVSAYVRNLFDTFRPIGRFPTPLAAQQLDPASYSQFVGPEAFRTFGISLDAKF